MKFAPFAIAAVSVALGFAACTGDDDGSGASSGATSIAGINPGDFTSSIDNPLFPIKSRPSYTYKGEETDPETGKKFTTRVELTVLPESDTVGGVEVTVVQDQAFEDDQLVEQTLDYYAQHKDGSVYYFGERVDNYEDGKVSDHKGSWLAGENGAMPGVMMPASPQVGDEFAQEKAPGVAEDSMTVLSVGESVTVPAGTFDGCIKTKDVNPLEAGAIEYKFFCPDVGFVREEFDAGFLDLTSSQ